MAEAIQINCHADSGCAQWIGILINRILRIVVRVARIAQQLHNCTAIIIYSFDPEVEARDHVTNVIRICTESFKWCTAVFAVQDDRYGIQTVPLIRFT